MTVFPQPADGDLPFNEPVAVTLQPSELAQLTFEPKQNSTTFVLPILAVSKHPGTEYRVKADGEVVYGPAPVPPTDIDDLQVTFIPARKFENSLLVEVVNVGNQEHRYAVQPVGWETTTSGGGS